MISAGDNAIQQASDEDVQRFISKTFAKDNGCWGWSGGSLSPFGYPQMWVKGRMIRCLRLSFFIHNGRLPVGVVRHTCDNPECTNPEHLVEGTQRQNVQDAKYRERLNTTLSIEQVREIKSRLEHGLHGIGRQLAREFGVSPQLICDIKKERVWSDVRPADSNERDERALNLIRSMLEQQEEEIVQLRQELNERNSILHRLSSFSPDIYEIVTK